MLTDYFRFIFFGKALALFILVLSIFSNIQLTYSSELQPKYGGKYRAPLRIEPVTLDPARYSDIYSMHVAANIFDGLVEFDQDLNIIPAIAKRWKISRDHLTYTFQLRQGVKFHNGREVTAEDFIYSFSRIIDSTTKSPAASLFFHIEGAEEYNSGKANHVVGLTAPSKNTLKIQLKKPFSPFLSILAMINAKVVPQEAIYADFGKNPVGTGPFRFITWKEEKEISLSANIDYFYGRPYLDQLQFHIYPNPEIYNNFLEEKLEHSELPKDQYELVNRQDQSSYSSNIVSKPALNLVYVGMNQRIPPFNDLRVRQAINYAIDTRTIVNDIVKKGSRPAKGILPPGIGGFDPNLEGYSYSPEKAHKLLAEAGYPQGSNFPPVTFLTASKSKNIHKQIKAYQSYLAELGIQVTIEVAENWKKFTQAIQSDEAALFFAGWYADYPDADNFLYPLFHSQSNYELSISIPEIDHMIDQARTETDYLIRSSLYKEIEKLIIEQAPVVSQHVNTNSYIFNSRVNGIEISPLGITYLPFRKIWLNDVKLSKASTN